MLKNSVDFEFEIVVQTKERDLLRDKNLLACNVISFDNVLVSFTR